MTVIPEISTNKRLASIPVGYVIGLIEVAIPKEGLKHALSHIFWNMVQAVSFTVGLVLLFGYQINRVSRELRESEEKTGVIVKTVGEGIIVIGVDSIIRLINQEVCNIFGYSEDELVGRNVQILMPEEYRAKHESGITRYLESGESKFLRKRVEVEGLRKDGAVFPIEIRVDEGTINGGTERFFTAAIRDITRRKKMQMEVARMADLAEDDPDPILEINLGKETIRYCNNAAKAMFPSLDPNPPGGKKRRVSVDWSHPLLSGLKSQVEEFTLDDEGKSLDLMEIEVGEKGTELYRVFGRKLRYIPEGRILRLYTVDLTRQEELSEVTHQLLEDVKKVRQELEDEHREAEEIGESLLRKISIDNRLVVSVGVEASSKAGGDRAGFIVEEKANLEKGLDWLVVLDASGHGNGAAKFQEVALGSIITSLSSKKAMKDALKTVNTMLEFLGTGRYLVGNIWRVMFADEKQIDDGYYWVEEYNLGQHPVLSLSPDGEEIKEWSWGEEVSKDSSFPLGMFRDGLKGLSPRFRKLKKGERVITYTDGITEALNGNGEQFGIKRLKDAILKTGVLQPDAARLEIIQEVKLWVGGKPGDIMDDDFGEVKMGDDITLAIIDVVG